MVDVYPVRQPSAPLAPREYLDRLLGDHVPDADVLRILSSLGFVRPPRPGDGWCDVPSWRVDATRAADLIEEVGRHWGLESRARNPAAIAHAAPCVGSRRPARSPYPRHLVRSRTAGSRDLHVHGIARRGTLRDRWASLVTIANPLSEKFAALRPSMWPGLLDALIYNRRRDMPTCGCSRPDPCSTPPENSQRVGWVLAGTRLSHWSAASGRGGSL